MFLYNVFSLLTINKTHNVHMNITSHSKKNWVRYYHKCTEVFKQSTCYSCQILIKCEFSWQIFENTQIYMKIRLAGAELLYADRWMVRWIDRHDKADSCFSHFYNAMKICSAGAELFHADRWMIRWTDRHDKANSWFSQFYNAMKIRSAGTELFHADRQMDRQTWQS